MPKYLVTHKIRTVATLGNDVFVAGFRLQMLARTNSKSEYWLASQEMDEANGFDAANRSRKSIMALSDTMAVVTQSAFSLVGQSFMSFKLSDNANNVVLVRVGEAVEPKRFELNNDKQCADIEQLIDSDLGSAIRYLRESINATTSGSCLAMLVVVAEALAGQDSWEGECECGRKYPREGTDRGKLREILGDEANNRLYKKKHGSIRNKLLHGTNR